MTSPGRKSAAVIGYPKGPCLASAEGGDFGTPADPADLDPGD